MKVVVQRVSQASVKVDHEITGKIGKGLLLLVAVHKNDDTEEMKWVADKIAKLRVFEDEEGKMNKSVLDISGELLVVSQFTLYGEVKKGTRPSFIESAQPEKAEDLYDEMIQYWENNYGIDVETGRFAAMMDVSLVNDGPVTLIIEKNKKDE
ncbi:MAG: D-aminoacyl-tRNA deacylase [Balneolales bacterium]